MTVPPKTIVADFGSGLNQEKTITTTTKVQYSTNDAKNIGLIQAAAEKWNESGKKDGVTYVNKLKMIYTANGKNTIDFKFDNEVKRSYGYMQSFSAIGNYFGKNEVVIGADKSMIVVAHEIGHAIYNINDAYRDDSIFALRDPNVSSVSIMDNFSPLLRAGIEPLVTSTELTAS